MNYELLPKQALFLLFVVLMLSSQQRLRVLRHNLNIHLMNGIILRDDYKRRFKTQVVFSKQGQAATTYTQLLVAPFAIFTIS